jgi:hypothetical protein
VLYLRGGVALARGDNKLAAELYLAAADIGSQVKHIHLSLATRALLWLGDIAGARAAVARFSEAAPGNGIDEVMTIAGDAGIAALEGRLEDAILGYREGLAKIGSLHVDWMVGMLGYEIVRLVGADHPATKEAAARAREVFERIKARPWLKLLDEAIASQPVTLARSTNAGSASAATSADPLPVEAPRA